MDAAPLSGVHGTIDVFHSGYFGCRDSFRTVLDLFCRVTR